MRYFMKDLKKIVGINLKYYRYKEGLSQEEFYEKYKLSVKYFANLERGNINMKLDTLQLLAEVLEVPPTELITFSEQRVITQKRIDEKSEKITN